MCTSPTHKLKILIYCLYELPDIQMLSNGGVKIIILLNSVLSTVVLTFKGIMKTESVHSSSLVLKLGRYLMDRAGWVVNSPVETT